ncbi:MAG: transketolase [Suipraeoptans sp.]
MDNQTKEMKKLALNIRIRVLKMLAAHGMGHVGGSLSVVDALAALYGGKLKHDCDNPKCEDRDYLVLSKGHCGPALYSTLAIKGFFDEKELYTLNDLGTILPSHCDKNLTPGIDMTTGSLGQGVSCALGMALGLKLDGKDNTVFAIIGDGESQEGQVWETMLIAPAKKANNMIIMMDNNKQQLDDFTDEICPLGDVRQKAEDFGWYALDVDGHDVAAIAEAIDKCKESDKPGFINMRTVKGKGWPEKEAINGNHGVKGMTPDTVKDLVDGMEKELAAL